MKRHADKHIHDLLQGDDQMEHVPHNDGNYFAGNMYGKLKNKTGADPKSIVRSMANLIAIKIELEELSNDNVYVIVECNGKTFVTTNR